MIEPSRCQSLIDRGQAARRDGRADDARRLFGEAIATARADGDLTGQGHALTATAAIARDTGNLDWAIHDQQEAIALFRKAGDGRSLAEALREAGEMFLDQQRIAHASVALREALDLHAANPDAPGLAVANATRAAALLAEAAGDPARAESFWRDAQAGYAALGDGEDVADALHEAEARLAALG